MTTPERPGDREEFARLYADGLKWTEIAIRLLKHKSTLIRWRAELGIGTRSKARIERYAELRRRFEHEYRTTQHGAKAIAGRLGVPASVALRWRRAMALPTKPRPSVRPRNLDLENARAWWAEVEREQRALIMVDECWRARPATPKRGSWYANFDSLEAARAYGAAIARRRHARLKDTPEWKVRQAARNAISRIARTVGYRRSPKTRTLEYLGCSYDFARAHIAARFQPGMSWENHGTVWHIDHIIPLAAFDLTSERQRKKAMHFTNLQPLFATDNRRKSAKVLRQELLAI